MYGAPPMGTPSKDWKEVVAPDEAQRFAGYAQYMLGLQRKAGQGGELSRGLHAKANVGAKAELTVLPDVPEVARAGLFASPGTYRCFVRYSNGNGARQHDAKGDVRGLAVKVLGVPGKKVIPGLEGATTQDFLCIRGAATSVKNTHEFIALVKALQTPTLLVPKLMLSLGPARAFGILKSAAKALSVPMLSCATTSYHSVAPLRWGDYAGKLSLHATVQNAPDAKRGPGPTFLHDELAARLKAGPVTYDVKVQLFVDEARTPIEDTTVEWSPDVAPFHAVGRLVLPSQDVEGADGVKLAAYVEKLSFDPWHALEAHRPLGDVMRARNEAYRVSTQARGALPEPEGADWAVP